MFRYIFVLLLVNASYRSLGNPINPTAPVTLANSLTALSGRCENAFLSNQIKNKIIYCSDLSQPHGEKQLQCLIFYDINTQLCSAVAAAKLALPEADYSAKINEEQDVNTLCSTAKDWMFTNLTEFARYKQAVDKLFKHPISCGKVCGVEDFMSDDANFFCKYYKWGTDMLKQQITITSTQENAINSADLPPNTAELNVDNKEAALSPNINDLQDVQIKSSTETKINTPTSNSPVKNDDAAGKIELVKPETSSLAVNQNSQLSERLTITAVAPEKVVNADTDVDNIEDTGAMPEKILTADDPPSKSPEDIAVKVDTVEAPASKPVTGENMQDKPTVALKTEGDKDNQLQNTELENKPPVLENPKGKVPNEVEDYQDSEEGKEGLSDIQGGDDGDDPMLGDVDTKLEEQNPPKKTDAVVTTFTGDKESFYVNPAQDAFPDDDDNFFPFFLTAIILAVLLYVLYHNKNKVGKVFFGLVLEGRQATRRRNSRGHAYRRLDTLEQAMSANTAAPPSKIIY